MNKYIISVYYIHYQNSHILLSEHHKVNILQCNFSHSLKNILVFHIFKINALLIL